MTSVAIHERFAFRSGTIDTGGDQLPDQGALGSWKKAAKLTVNGEAVFVSDAVGQRDILLASPPSLTAHFPPAGNFSPEL